MRRYIVEMETPDGMGYFIDRSSCPTPIDFFVEDIEYGKKMSLKKANEVYERSIKDDNETQFRIIEIFDN